MSAIDEAKPKFRRAGKTDAAAVRQLTRDVYAKWIPAIGREPLPMLANYETAVEEHWIELLEHDRTLIALIEMIAFADHLYIENLAVTESHQGQGLARTLLNRAAELARKSDLPELRLLTNKAFTSNIVMYNKLGFELYHETPFLGGGTICHFRKPVS